MPPLATWLMGGACDPEAHLQSVGRGAVCPLGGETLHALSKRHDISRNLMRIHLEDRVILNGNKTVVFSG